MGSMIFKKPCPLEAKTCPVGDNFQEDSLKEANFWGKRCICLKGLDSTTTTRKYATSLFDFK